MTQFCLFPTSVPHCCLEGCFKVEGHAGRPGRKVCMRWLTAPLTENTFRRPTHFTHCSDYCGNNISLNYTSAHCLTLIKKEKLLLQVRVHCAVKVMLLPHGGGGGRHPAHQLGRFESWLIWMCPSRSASCRHARMLQGDFLLFWLRSVICPAV